MAKSRKQFVGVFIIIGISAAGVLNCSFSANILTSDTLEHTVLDSDTNPYDTFVDTDTILTAETDSCFSSDLQANEILFAGDEWIRLPGTEIVDTARAEGILDSNESYVILAAPGASIADAVNQYNTQEAGVSKVKVLIMNGGGIDLILENGSQASADQVVSVFRDFLDKLEEDGTVEHIIYSLYPEVSSTPGVANLRPGMQAACEESENPPCYFLNLQDYWDRPQEYTVGVIPTDAGTQIIAREIWNIIKRNCISM